MNVAQLVRMANDIGNFFRGETREEDQIAGVTNHLRKFWDLRMRRQLVAHLSAGGEGLLEPARSAVLLLAQDSKAKSKPET